MYRYLIKTFFVIIIGLVLLICFKVSPKFKDDFKEKVYRDNISFSYINNIYEKYLGDSMLFKKVLDTEPVFNEMEIKDCTDYLEGIECNVSLVTNLSEGIVTFVGKKEGYGNVVIIVDDKNYEIWYGNISSTSLTLYDYLKKGEIIGETDKLYLLIKKDGNVIKYEDFK